MRYVTTKTAKDINLDGITIVFDMVNDQLRGVHLRDSKGSQCRVVMESYNMTAQIPAPPKKEKRYVLHGELPVIGKIARQFNEKYEADAAKSELVETVRGDTEFTISCEEVEVDDGGAAKTTGDDIPF